VFPFRHGTSIDNEFRADPGHLPYVHLLVARDLIAGKEIGRWWRRDLLKMRRPPFPTGKDALVVSYGVSAEMACFLQLGWKPPEYLLDLYAEFRWLTNGRKLEFAGKDMEKLKKHKNSMLAAAFIVGVPLTMDLAHKETMRLMFMNKWEFTPEEEILGGNYCADDTLITQQIYQAMEPVIDWPRALLRGRFGLAVARMERTAVPVDMHNVTRINDNWSDLMVDVIEATNEIYTTEKDSKRQGIFIDGEVSDGLLAGYARQQGMYNNWPKTKTGKLSRKKEVMKRLVEIYPQLDILKEVLSTKGATRLLGLSIGPDGRNRANLISFRSKTARNQPSSKEYIFGPAVWLRSLIEAEPGFAVAYLDFAAEEVRILAALSQDPNLMADCLSGDPYMAFAIRASMVPPEATRMSTDDAKAAYGAERDLSLNYGRAERGLAEALGWPLWRARDLMKRHIAAYPQAHRWLQGVINHASIHGWQQSAFGWRRFVLAGFNPRSIRNWPCQTAGSEIMMLAAILLTEAGIEVCAPVHDAFLIQAPLDQIEAVVARARVLMEEAARMVTGGFPIPVDAKIYPHGTHYTDKRGTRMWDLITGLYWTTGTPGRGGWREMGAGLANRDPRSRQRCQRGRVPFLLCSSYKYKKDWR
jgi:DNA polymerase I